MSARVGIASLLLLLCAASCGREVETPPTLADVQARAGEAAARGEWATSAELHAAAFALVDPVPEHAVERAAIALQRARALAKAGWCIGALEWYRIAERLDRDLWHVAYECARLHDGDCPETHDPGEARREYERFLYGHEIRMHSPYEERAVEVRRRLDQLPVPQR